MQVIKGDKKFYVYSIEVFTKLRSPRTMDGETVPSALTDEEREVIKSNFPQTVAAYAGMLKPYVEHLAETLFPGRKWDYPGSGIDYDSLLKAPDGNQYRSVLRFNWGCKPGRSIDKIVLPEELEITE